MSEYVKNDKTGKSFPISYNALLFYIVIKVSSLVDIDYSNTNLVPLRYTDSVITVPTYVPGYNPKMLIPYKYRNRTWSSLYL